jgi:tRNA threonylcarbamoyladenosine biosynthesis protein TsaE
MILSESELVRWGERIGREVALPVFIALRGPLGAGKSVLARAVARGAGVVATMPSPTFNLVFTYHTERGASTGATDPSGETSARDPSSGEDQVGAGGADAATSTGVAVVHADLYRIQDPSELWELGWEELGAGPELILVEWPERAGPLLPDDRWEVGIVPTAPGSGFREVSVERVGNPPHLPGFPVSVDQEEGPR